MNFGENSIVAVLWFKDFWENMILILEYLVNRISPKLMVLLGIVVRSSCLLFLYLSVEDHINTAFFDNLHPKLCDIMFVAKQDYPTSKGI